MEINYTKINEESIYNDYLEVEDTADAADYLKNPSNFRSFKEGLTEMLKKTDYTTENKNVYQMSDYLYEQMKKINSSVTKDTVLSWFRGEHRPKINSESRKKMYEICFALHADYQQTLWFFNHVYYDRAFNCHTINEAVFYYAFRKNISYQEANEIIEEINDTPSPCCPESQPEINNYTKYVKNQISEFQSTDELKHFLIYNKESFRSWNKSAFKTIKNLVKNLLGSPKKIKKIKEEIDKLRPKLRENEKEKISLKDLKTSDYNISKLNSELNLNKSEFQNECLLIRYIFYKAKQSSEPSRYLYACIQKTQISSNDFLLKQMLTSSRLFYTKDDKKKEEIQEIPDIVRNSFPTKKTLSDVLSDEKISTSQSYDAIRKMIVLLDFYRFWINIELSGNTTNSRKDLPSIYADETNYCLSLCGYDELTAVNPYDWIFLCSSNTDDPIEFFRSFIDDLLPSI